MSSSAPEASRLAKPWPMLALVAVALILSMTTWFSATAVLTELQKAFHLTPAGASWLTNAVQIGFVVAALGLSLSGLIDAIPAPRLMTAAALLAAAANAAALLAPDASWLFAARAVNGMALAGVYPPALKLIASWFVRGRGLAMGVAIGALTLGSSAPYLFKAVGARWDWRIVLVGATVAALASALAFAFTSEGPHAAARPKPSLSRFLGVLRDPDLSLANLGYFGHMWELYAMWGWFLAFAGDAARTHAVAGPLSPPLLTFLVVAVGCAGCLFGGVLADRIGRTATTAAMMVASGCCAATIGFAFDGPAWLFVTIALVWGFTIIADSAQFSAMVTEISDAETSGAALALQVGIGFALTILSIRLTPMLAVAIGWRWTFVMLAPGPFVGAVAMLVLRGRPRAAEIANGLR